MIRFPKGFVRINGRWKISRTLRQQIKDRRIYGTEGKGSQETRYSLAQVLIIRNMNTLK